MIGCNPDALDGVAGRYDSLRATLDGLAEVGQAIASATWEGDDADQVRQDWWRRVDPQVSSSAAGLDALAKRLRDNAAAQRRVSQSSLNGRRPSALRPTPVGAAGDDAELLKWYNDFIMGPLGFGLTAAGAFVVDVSGHLRSGSEVAAYSRWWPRTADSMKPIFGEAGRFQKVAKGFAIVGAVADFGIGAWEQHSRDADAGFAADERVGRAVTAGAIDAGVSALSMKAGMVAGTFLLGPGPGTAVGAGVGYVAGAGINWGLDETGAQDWLVDRGGEVGDFVGDRVDDAAGVVSDSWKEVASWF